MIKRERGGVEKKRMNEKVYVVTNKETGKKEIMKGSEAEKKFEGSQDASDQGFKVEHILGLSMDSDGKIWGRPDSNYVDFVQTGDSEYDNVSREEWCEMEFSTDN